MREIKIKYFFCLKKHLQSEQTNRDEKLWFEVFAFCKSDVCLCKSSVKSKPFNERKREKNENINKRKLDLEENWKAKGGSGEIERKWKFGC